MTEGFILATPDNYVDLLGAVVREVREEVGIDVLQHLASGTQPQQLYLCSDDPWPTFMLSYIAQLALSQADLYDLFRIHQREELGEGHAPELADLHFVPRGSLLEFAARPGTFRFIRRSCEILSQKS